MDTWFIGAFGRWWRGGLVEALYRDIILRTRARGGGGGRGRRRNGNGDHGKGAGRGRSVSDLLKGEEGWRSGILGFKSLDFGEFDGSW